MDDETRFRQQAEACRDRALTLSDSGAAQQWIKIAEEYERLAVTAAAMKSAPKTP